MKKYCYLLLIIPLLFAGCSDDNEEPKLAELPDVNIVDISQESDWDFWVFGKDDYYFIKANSSSTLPESVLYHSSEINKDFSIFFTDEGLVDKVVLDNHIFVFRNFNGNYVDLGVVYPDGKIEIFREIETPNYNWETLTFSKSNSLKDFRSELVRWTGHTIAGIPCALSAAAAIPTGGLSLIPAGITCGLFLARLTGDIYASDFNIPNGLDEMFMNGANPYDIGDTFLDCAFSGSFNVACISEILINSYEVWTTDLGWIDDLSGSVLRSLTGAIENGYGDVQITLTWDNGADLDLHVVDPNGEEIWWNHKYSATNGTLDIDDVDGYGPENIFWPQLEAPNGTYQVYVHHYPSSPAISKYIVLINAFGETKTYSGSISNDQWIHIKDFDQNGFKSSLIKDSFSISTNLIKQ
ncbi:MAG: hypothetical protein DRJ07_01440 [Bacteroidetes bacterium]|nr:MAG: hypothetical protein DRJ07_01440 [Bacteroidota bacterium]